jgi:hypothetical protein
MSTPAINTIGNHQDQNILEYKSKSSVTTHLIGDWIIRESLEPFQRKENNSSLSIKQKQQVCLDKSNIRQWNVSHLVQLFVKLISKSFEISNSFAENIFINI